MATAVPFFPTFWPTFVATIVGGAVLLGLGYWLVDLRLHLRDRADRVAEDEHRAAELREMTLRLVHGELKSAASLIPTFIKAIAAGNVPYPPLDTNGWTLLSQAQALVTLKPATAESLTMAYNRMRTTNRQIEEFTNLTIGPAAAMVHATIGASAPDETLPPLAQRAYDQYQELRSDLRKGIPQRLYDLRKNLDAAIDAVEAELGEPGEVPSAMREYVGDPDSIGDLT